MPNTQVMMNSHIHHLGIGLFISTISSSNTWPVVLSSLIFLTLLVISSKVRQPTMPPMTMNEIKYDQKLLVKSLIILSLKRQFCRLIKIVLIAFGPSPHPDSNKGHKGSER